MRQTLTHENDILQSPNKQIGCAGVMPTESAKDSSKELGLKYESITGNAIHREMCFRPVFCIVKGVCYIVFFPARFGKKHIFTAENLAKFGRIRCFLAFLIYLFVIYGAIWASIEPALKSHFD